MKKVYKDIIISIVIGISLSYIVYLLKGGILYGDMYNQGIDFLEYYRNNVSIFGLGYDYNWSIALGDNMYSLGIYYLMSPFNIILILFKNINMEIILTLFITIKFIFFIYF
ncbi:MAG: YfhO family protein [Clostridium sp.]|nr:YfhO family protein [Clostridium sp.]MBS5950927.1 YfhO family protein [Clostridium sp.]